VVLLLNGGIVSGIDTARKRPDQSVAASTGWASGHAAAAGAAVGLPNSDRTAATTALTVIHSATTLRPSGSGDGHS
jgi:hypothetical protein